MKIKLSVLIFLLTILILVSCDRPDCTNTNPVFDEYTPESEVYKQELTKILQTVDRRKLTYWLKDYRQINDKEFLYFYIQGDGLCAVIPLQMKHWDKLEDLQPKKGSGRFNAEFVNLEFDIVTGPLSTTFIYKSYDRIID